MEINVGWTELKEFVVARNISIQYITVNGKYYLFAIDNPMSLNTQIPIESPAGLDQVDFETNFKSLGNKKITNVITGLPDANPFSAKVLPNGKKLFKRLHGLKANVVIGPNDSLFTVSYPSVKITGLEFINSSLGDTVSLYILDSTTGTYSGYPNLILNQFAFDLNVSSDFYKYHSEYDADLYQGMQIKIVVNSISIKSIGINLVLNEVK